MCFHEFQILSDCICVWTFEKNNRCILHIVIIIDAILTNLTCGECLPTHLLYLWISTASFSSTHSNLYSNVALLYRLPSKNYVSIVLAVDVCNLYCPLIYYLHRILPYYYLHYHSELSLTMIFPNTKSTLWIDSLSLLILCKTRFLTPALIVWANGFVQ